MPLYEFECPICREVYERQYRISECPKTIQCIDCDADAVMIISRSSIQCDSANNVPWLKRAEQVIKPAHETKPWETRRDYVDCLKRNGLEPGR